MLIEKSKDALSLSYKTIDEDGKDKVKSVTFSNLNDEVTNENLYEVALLVKGLMAFGVEKISRKSEIIFLED